MVVGARNEDSGAKGINGNQADNAAPRRRCGLRVRPMTSSPDSSGSVSAGDMDKRIQKFVPSD